VRRLALLCLPALALLVPAAPAMARPNVVVLMTDDQTLESMAAMPQTNLLLGAQGTVFEDAISTFPLCCPSRSTALTGQYSHNHGVISNKGAFGGHRVLDHANTLPVWLQQAGYRTMHVGRYLNGYEYSDGIPPGWSDWHGSPHSAAFNYVRWRVNENGSLVQYPVASGRSTSRCGSWRRTAPARATRTTRPRRAPPRRPRGTATCSPGCRCPGRPTSTRRTCTTSRRRWPTARG
jgi:arylsulfatase A-like enzyme